MPRSGLETEVKLRVRGLSAVRRRLRQKGFHVIQRRSFEENALFDTAQRRLRRQGSMVRLRSIGGCHWLTFKGPAMAARRYKVRREFETELKDASAARAILAGLGFEPVFRYEKFRTVYAGRSGWRGGEVLLDETPIGEFLELEGGRGWIRRVARALGAGPEDFITETYAALYAEWCRRQGRPARHMLFPRRW